MSSFFAFRSVSAGMAMVAASVGMTAAAQAAPVTITAQGVFKNWASHLPDFDYWTEAELSSPVSLEILTDTEFVGRDKSTPNSYDFDKYAIRITVTTSERQVVSQGPWVGAATFTTYGGPTRDELEIDLPAMAGSRNAILEWSFFYPTTAGRFPMDFSQASFGQDDDNMLIWMDHDPVEVAFDPASVVVTVVPEPGAMVGLGMGALLMRRRRHNHVR